MKVSKLELGTLWKVPISSQSTETNMIQSIAMAVNNWHLPYSLAGDGESIRHWISDNDQFKSTKRYCFTRLTQKKQFDEVFLKLNGSCLRKEMKFIVCYIYFSEVITPNTIPEDKPKVHAPLSMKISYNKQPDWIQSLRHGEFIFSHHNFPF